MLSGGCNNARSPPGAMPWVQTACRQPCRDPPQKADVSAALPWRKGCSFNLNNCCQGFSSDSFVSETGSLVSRGLSGDQPPPRVAKAPRPEGLSAPPSARSSRLLFSKTFAPTMWAQTGFMCTGVCCLHPKRSLLCHGG